MIKVGMAVIIISKYITLNDDFNLQMKEFYYIPWGMQMRVFVSIALKDHSLYQLLEESMFSGRSDKLALQAAE